MLASWGAIGLVPIRRPAPTPKVNRMRYGVMPETEPVTTVRVRMVKTSQATLDQRTTLTLEAGTEYDLPEWLAQAFFKGGEADPAEAYEALDNTSEQTHPAPATTPRRRGKK